ncbi:M23 family metallopeptidase [Acinetobacter ihumii]|uniref:M23 family metallopeptidase n=1 Tax=Acinetobacter ihumii TaxID=2483802 RepID=UPI001030F718|nr:M23 family metallopeptidase [Acinetobacter ihumii]
MSNIKIFSFLLIVFLTGCEPIASGESVGVQYPLKYMQLMQSDLPDKVMIPVQGVNSRQIQDTWGAARSENRKHEGVDIFAQRGTPVMSATQGIVSNIGTNSLGGQVVWILGPDLSRHYYAHLDGYAEQISVGNWVEAGELIGYVGNTGNAKATPPHLHYGIYLTGQGAVNPYPYLMTTHN